MGPLVPDIISNEFNFVVALIVGIAFGFVLEQAGFSSTKKLVGLFYGYDFTVLKVFFTAGVTAMIGVLFLAHFGLLNMDMIYVNPTFLRSAIIGGLIMGAGFIIGGFCPGTSLVGLAIGKIDAFWFVFGGVLGVFIFTEIYPLIDQMYVADNMGNLRISTFLGISHQLFAFILTAVAITAFYITQKIQDKMNNVKQKFTKITYLKYGSLTILPFLILLISWVTPSKEQMIKRNINNPNNQTVVNEITSDKLAFELINNSYKINLIDIRSIKEYKKYHLPLAINIPFDSMMNIEYRKIITNKYKTFIFYGNSNTDARKAYLLAKYYRDADDYILIESPDLFEKLIMNAQKPCENASKNEFMLYDFRCKAAIKINELAMQMKNQNDTIKKTIKKVKGGCS